MIVKAQIRPNSYFDSLVLMRISTQLMALPGVIEASVMMATEQNRKSIGNPALLIPEVMDASANDLFVVVAAESEEEASAALDSAMHMLTVGRGRSNLAGGKRVATLQAALRQQPHSNLAVLSIPGRYVKREALKALDARLHLLVFSDNVPLDDEIEIKRIGQERGLLVMGPDCGTAIIGGVALAFANAVRQGRIGLVGASGTGLQEVSCLIDHLGEGVSHAIGTGSHDVDEAVGGITVIQGLQRLQADPSTEILVVVSKPPARTVVRQVMAVVRSLTKPVIVNFLGGDPELIRSGGGIVAHTLEDAAVQAVARLKGVDEEAVRARLRALDSEEHTIAELAKQTSATLASGQRFVRGLYSGGTFASEASMLLCEALGTIHTNVKIGCATRLTDPRYSFEHTCVDLGDDLFTVGRPHPMLEPAIRRERLIAEMQDPETAVILLDVVLGYGVHPDPAGELARFIVEARQFTRERGPAVPVVASVCGVDADPQNRAEQVKKLVDVGVLVMASNAQAARLAAAIIERRQRGSSMPPTKRYAVG